MFTKRMITVAALLFGANAASAADLYTTVGTTDAPSTAAICDAVNVSTKPRDIVVDMLKFSNGASVASQSCSQLAVGTTCSAVLSSSPADGYYCKITVAGKKTHVRGGLTVFGPSPTFDTRAVIPAS